MAYDVFLSYARADADKALIIKEALEALGLTVFYDIEGLDGGDVFPEVLEQEIKAAGATIGIWNTHALSRDWVRRESEIARECRTLIPMEIGPISDSVMTVALSKLHRLKLHDFDGSADDRAWQDVIRALAKLLKKPELLKARKDQAKEEARAEKLEAELAKQRAQHAALKRSKDGWRAWQIGLVGAVTLMLAGGGAWWGWQQQQARADLVAYLTSPESRTVRDRMATFDQDELDARASLARVLNDVEVAQLERAAELDARAALLAGWAHEFGQGGVTKDLPRSV